MSVLSIKHSPAKPPWTDKLPQVLAGVVAGLFLITVLAVSLFPPLGCLLWKNAMWGLLFAFCSLEVAWGSWILKHSRDQPTPAEEQSAFHFGLVYILLGVAGLFFGCYLWVTSLESLLIGCF
ncbi:MAG TPA: hypothetical protein VLU25_13680 [Acidobacteriota bacterium]|nr:hypothetical protein [Acidobacteriota bacterium]